MTRYLVVRTDKNRAAYVLKELEAGRLRQGWGWKPEQDLRAIRQKIHARAVLSKEESAAWRNRRLLDTEWDGAKPGDVIIVPNQPSQGTWVLARVTGPYRYEPPAESEGVGTDYAHVVPIELIRNKLGRLAIVESDNQHVDARLRASMNTRSRLWSVDNHRDRIDALIAAIGRGEDTSSAQPVEQKLDQLSTALLEATWQAVLARYKGAELEQLVLRVLEQMYSEVTHHGGRSERGADLIAIARDPLGLEYRIGVQVKLHYGEEHELRSLEQIRQAHAAHRLDAGLVVTTATDFSDEYEEYQARLETELGIDIKLIRREEFLRLVLALVAAPA